MMPPEGGRARDAEFAGEAGTSDTSVASQFEYLVMTQSRHPRILGGIRSLTGSYRRLL
jgi:hypothetical protein